MNRDSIITERTTDHRGPGPTMFLDLAAVPTAVLVRIAKAARIVAIGYGNCEIGAIGEDDSGDESLETLSKAVDALDVLFTPTAIPPAVFGSGGAPTA